MLVGAYPFEDPEEPKNFRKTIHVRHISFYLFQNGGFSGCLSDSTWFLLVQRILNVQYSIPDYVHISPECRHLLSRIFVAEPEKVSICEICLHGSSLQSVSINYPLWSLSYCATVMLPTSSRVSHRHNLLISFDKGMVYRLPTRPRP